MAKPSPSAWQTIRAAVQQGIDVNRVVADFRRIAPDIDSSLVRSLYRQEATTMRLAAQAGALDPSQIVPEESVITSRFFTSKPFTYLVEAEVEDPTTGVFATRRLYVTSDVQLTPNQVFNRADDILEEGRLAGRGVRYEGQLQDHRLAGVFRAR